MTDTDLDAFRARCREFLQENASPLQLDGPDPRDDQTVAHSKAFLKKLAEAGLGGLTYGSEYGGAGLTKAEERVWREEYAHFPDCSGAYTISHGMCLPMMNEFGTEEQKKQYMPRMISGEDMWCQMFSEPGAGSDVASLQTKAVKDGDQWIINGQKVWTTLAHHSNYGLIVARTDPELVKHAGLSMFMIDMRDPAVEIRPIHQIDGGMHFNEIFFTDLAIPSDWLVGEYNAGWKQATAMLMYERVAIGTGSKSGITTPMFNRIKREATKLGTIQDPIVRDKLMQIYSQEVTKSLVAMRTRAEMKAGKAPGPGGSLGKLHGSNIGWMTREVLHEMVGPQVMAYEQGDEHAEEWSKYSLRAFMGSIAGGTDEIQRNIIGDRVLGLPRDVSVDKGVPFNELKVGTINE